MMGILVPETCWGNKTAYFVARSWFFTFTMSTMNGHMNIKFKNKVCEFCCDNQRTDYGVTRHKMWYQIACSLKLVKKKNEQDT
jgi:hypothetical protein